MVFTNVSNDINLITYSYHIIIHDLFLRYDKNGLLETEDKTTSDVMIHPQRHIFINI